MCMYRDTSENWAFHIQKIGANHILFAEKRGQSYTWQRWKRGPFGTHIHTMPYIGSYPPPHPEPHPPPPRVSTKSCFQRKCLLMLNIKRLKVNHPCQASWTTLWENVLYNMYRITKTRLFKYIENFTTKESESVEIKNSDIFHISAQNINCGYSLEPTTYVFE